MFVSTPFSRLFTDAKSIIECRRAIGMVYVQSVGRLEIHPFRSRSIIRQSDSLASAPHSLMPTHSNGAIPRIPTSTSTPSPILRPLLSALRRIHPTQRSHNSLLVVITSPTSTRTTSTSSNRQLRKEHTAMRFESLRMEDRLRSMVYRTGCTKRRCSVAIRRRSGAPAATKSRFCRSTRNWSRSTNSRSTTHRTR